MIDVPARSVISRRSPSLLRQNENQARRRDVAQLEAAHRRHEGVLAAHLSEAIQFVRRASPSERTSTPAASCIAMCSRMTRSSTACSAALSILPSRNACRASCR